MCRNDVNICGCWHFTYPNSSSMGFVGFKVGTKPVRDQASSVPVSMESISHWYSFGNQS